MRDTVMRVLFGILLSGLIIKVHLQPYKADANGECRDPQTEYLQDEDSNLCCRKCRPGTRQMMPCSDDTDSVCQPCLTGQFMENWNYSPNCFSCGKCKESKGLQYAQNCSSTTNSKCVCQSGMYCTRGFESSSCTECRKYRSCKPGEGVIKKGTLNSNVQCARCPDGTFSEKSSYTETCQPHTDCQGRGVLKKGSSTSDNVCESVDIPHTVLSPYPPTESETTFATTVVTSTRLLPQPTMSDSTLNPLNHTNADPKTLRPQPGSNVNTVVVIASSVGSITLLIIVLTVLVTFEVTQRKDTRILTPKTDANGNCDALKINTDYPVRSKVTPLTVVSPEAEHLLESAEPSSTISQSNNNIESTALPSISDYPMTLLSNTELGSSQAIIPPQPPQPTTQQHTGSLPTSPQVNVNITFHIGNGSCATPSVAPVDSTQADLDLPLGKEGLNSLSIPQQEMGKQELVAVQEIVSSDETTNV